MELSTIQVFGKANCSKCDLMKKFLDKRELKFNYNNVTDDILALAEKENIDSYPIVKFEGKLWEATAFKKHIIKVLKKK